MTIILAKILGLYFLGAGLAFILNPKRLGEIYQLMQKNEIIPIFGGMISLLGGAFIVSVHNVWVMDWPVVITIIGWWSLFKGFAFLTFSGFIQYFSFLSQRSDAVYRGLGCILFVLGLFLSYHGWYQT